MTIQSVSNSATASQLGGGAPKSVDNDAEDTGKLDGNSIVDNQAAMGAAKTASQASGIGVSLDLTA